MQTISQDHCQSCGETDREYINPYSNYSSCCNECIITPLPGEECDEIYCSHPDPTAEELAAQADEERVQAERQALIGTRVRTATRMQGRFYSGEEVEILDTRYSMTQGRYTYYRIKGLGRRDFTMWVDPDKLDLPTT